MKRLLLMPIGAYRRWISRRIGSNCMYHPTCSAFAYEAVDRYGSLRGSLLALRRIARCHPYATGGYDPVP